MRACCVANLLLAATADLRFGNSNDASISVSGSVSVPRSKVTFGSSREDESMILGVF